MLCAVCAVSGLSGGRASVAFKWGTWVQPVGCAELGLRVCPITHVTSDECLPGEVVCRLVMLASSTLRIHADALAGYEMAVSRMVMYN
jgi:hypothetical protein